MTVGKSLRRILLFLSLIVRDYRQPVSHRPTMWPAEESQISLYAYRWLTWVSPPRADYPNSFWLAPRTDMQDICRRCYVSRQPVSLPTVHAPHASF
jgi:hypothetical protein